MKTLQFKTNMKCSGCKDTVTPFLNSVSEIKKWEVDTTSKDKILTVDFDGTNEEVIVKKVEEAGFKIEKISL
ncbi:heavy-metal-associated domain-containing protein [Flavobacterium antarcticum]|uniref:heavy-metal-associated domain-containing protein n=1 Tax=Flavobacterium antarcticum TaxID=271155 RepID=UPI0003B2F27A|nr:heavy-metal-associated domain-containing protein [Flavobacterium antarcticum]